MSSLDDCLKRFAKNINREDATALRSAVARRGNDKAAEQAALRELEAQVIAEKQALIDQIVEAGGNRMEWEERLSMDEIEFNERLDEAGAAIEREFAEFATGMPWDQLRLIYNGMTKVGDRWAEDTEGGRLLNPDAARELSEAYRRNRLLANPTHEVASSIIKRLFRERLAEPVIPGERWLFTAGGPASGKSGSMNLSEFAEEAPLVYDGVLGNFEKDDRKKIGEVLKTGRNVGIMYVYADPVKSFVGAMVRAQRQKAKLGSGRTVSIPNFIEGTVGARVSIEKYLDKYQGDPRVAIEVFYNRHLEDENGVFAGLDPQQTTIDQIPQISRADLADRVLQQLDEMRAAGEIDNELYTATRETARGYGLTEAAVGEATEGEAGDATPAAEMGGLGQGEQPGPVAADFARADAPAAQPAPDAEQQRRQHARLRLALARPIRQLSGTLNVQLVQSPDELPEGALPADDPAGETVEGMWRVGTDEVYLVSQNLPDVNRAQRVLAHEAFGHYAMERIPEFGQVLKAVQNMKATGNRQVTEAAARVAATQGVLDSTAEAKEIVATMVEQGVQSTAVDRAMTAARRALRRLGFSIDMNDAELRTLITEAARGLQSEAKAKQAALANMPAQQQILEDPNAVAASIRNAIEEIYARQTMQDMIGSLHSELQAIEGEPGQEDRVAEIKAGFDRLRNQPKANPDVMYARAYHGTPHTFGEFSITAIGTGEGAQAFGWGLYFSDSKGVAEYYQRQLSQNTGNLMQVEIPDNDDLLRWDDTINEHSPAVQEKIKSEYPELFKENWYAPMRGTLLENPTVSESELERMGYEYGYPANSMNGFALYNYIALEESQGNQSAGDNDRAASMKLADMGIPGHSFIGNSSNELNYVIYDDSVITTTAINDQPVQPREPEQQVLFSRTMGSPEIEEIRARVLSPAREDIGVRDRFRSVVDYLRGLDWLSVKQGVIDSAASVEALERQMFGDVLDASQSAYKAVLATKNIGSVMAAVMQRGVPVLRNGVFQPRQGRKGFVEIFQPITQHSDGNLLPLWELYAVARRADRLIGETNPDGTSKEKLMSREDIDQALALGQQYPEFETAFLEWNTLNQQALDLAIRTGVINRDEAQIWARNDYVPFYRAMEEVEYSDRPGQGPRTGGQIEGVRPRIRRLTGSETQIGNVFENMIMNTSYLIDASFRNDAMQRIVAMADGVAMEQVPMRYEAIKFSNADLARALMRAGLIVGNGVTQSDMLNDAITQIEAMTPEQKERWSTLFRRVAPVGDDIVSVMQNGKPVYYQVSDPLLLRTVGGLGAHQWGGIMTLFRGSKKLLTSAVTIDPAFMMANFVRDTLSSWVVADTGAAAPPLLEALKGASAAFNEDEDTIKIMMAGAGGGGFYDHNPDDVRRMLAAKMPSSQINGFMQSIITPRGLWRTWQKIGNAAEQANRIAKYRRVLRDGGSEAEAAYQARDVLNFSMSGDYAAIKFLTQSVPFLNARLQGLYRLWRGGQENPFGFWMKGMSIAAATMALALRNLDDERYEELPEWDKDTYWHFFLGDEHLRLPKPFEVGAMFATVPERMMRAAAGRDDWELFGSRVFKMVTETLQFNPTPQLVKPIVEQYANRNMFTGAPIVGFNLQGLKPEAQYDHWTSETMREWAQAVPEIPGTDWLRSPKRLEAAVRGYTGAIGMYVLGASDAVTRRAMGHPDRPTKTLQDMPVVSRFWRNPQPRTSKYTSQLYDMLKEADALHRTLNAYQAQGRMDDVQDLVAEGQGKLAVRKYLHGIAAQVREINKQMKIVAYSDMSPAEKQAAMDKLNAAKLSAVRQVAHVAEFF